jgi:hypothetical protein
MLDVALNIGDTPAGVALIPRAIKFLGRRPKLDDEIAGEIRRFGLATLLASKADQRSFIITQDDPSI